MNARRTIPVLLFAAATAASLAACKGKEPEKQELELANTVRTDSVSTLRNELLEQVMEGTRFVNEINKELSKARSLTVPAKQLQSDAELADANQERKQVVAKITQLVARLDQVQARLANARTQLAEKDSALSNKVAAYETMVADINRAAERQRTEFQLVIDSQTVKIASLSGQVDTLNGKLSRLTDDYNAVYYVVGTKKELLAKGVLVPEGRKRFLLAGGRPAVPTREPDPGVFTKIDRLSDRTINLPAGEYQIVSRQSSAYATPQVAKDGKIAGALKIEQPERFWSSSRFLIIVRT
jgi:multidrug efflux pump subunit AcrA (membrane-fusion protein)